MKFRKGYYYGFINNIEFDILCNQGIFEFFTTDIKLANQFGFYKKPKIIGLKGDEDTYRLEVPPNNIYYVYKASTYCIHKGYEFYVEHPTQQADFGKAG